MFILVPKVESQLRAKMGWFLVPITMFISDVDRVNAVKPRSRIDNSAVHESWPLIMVIAGIVIVH